MMLNKEDFRAGSRNFETKVEFGSGTRGGPSISHPTLLSTIRQLNSSDLKLRVVFETTADLHSNFVIKTKSGLLGLFGSPVQRGNLITMEIPYSAILGNGRAVRTQ
mmetsp:Transcript_16803/g.21418  ORF Transcript_16803/g.21418 Transcript_16803/m.21418 type:complete len:106 (-) Transcript_16803:32-349(-)